MRRVVGSLSNNDRHPRQGGDDDNDQRINDSADDDDYDPAPVANPTPKSWPKKVQNKNNKLKLYSIVTSCASSNHIHLIMNHSGGESKTCSESPRWNDSTPTFACNCTLIFLQHGQPRNRSNQLMRLVLLAASVMSILMLSWRIPLPCQSYQASGKNFRAMFWRTFWTAPLVADSCMHCGGRQ